MCPATGTAQARQVIVVDFVSSGASFVLSSTARCASEGKADKLINAIKLRDIAQIKTILDEDGELVNVFDETVATLFTTRRLMGCAKSSNCYSTEAQKSTAETAGLVLRQPVGQSSICERGAAILALSSKTLLMPLSLEMLGGWRDFWNAFLRFARAEM
jgi:hypothetical protein